MLIYIKKMRYLKNLFFVFGFFNITDCSWLIDDVFDLLIALFIFLNISLVVFSRGNKE